MENLTVTREYGEDAIIDTDDFLKVLEENKKNIKIRLLKAKEQTDKEIYTYEITAYKP